MSDKQIKIILASDHAGFELKEKVKTWLTSEGYSVDDVGNHKLVDGDDYPEFMTKAAAEVFKDISGGTKAILFGGSGQGEAIVANRFPGVRAAVWYGGNEEVIRHSRNDNDSNVFSIGARYVSEDEAKNAIKIWLETPFSDEERHSRRIEQIDSIE